MVSFHSTPWGVLTLLLATTCWYQITAQDYQSSANGKDFYIGFMQSREDFRSNVTLRLIVGTHAPSASFEVSDSSGTVIDSKMVESSAPVVVDIDVSFLITSTGIIEADKGIRVYSLDEDIFVIVESSVASLYHGTFLAYPVMDDTEERYEYLIISAEEPSDLSHSQFLLVASHDNTSVSLITTQTVGIVPDFTLERFQTVLIASVSDLTGSKIVSNKPLTVVSGHECASLQGDFINCEPLAFQVPPLDTWGTHFLLAPYAGRETPQKFRLISMGNTSVEYTCGNITESADDVTDLAFHTSEYCSLSSKKPILVVQLSAGAHIDSKGDPVVALVAPVDQYISSSKFAILQSSDFPTSYISVTVLAEHFDASAILLNGEALNCSWEDIKIPSGEICGYGCSYKLSGSTEPAYHTVSHAASGGKISVLVYGFNSDPLASSPLGYAYLAGQSIQKTDPLGWYIPFLDLTQFPGVKELDNSQPDSTSQPIHIPKQGLLFGDRLVTTAYVNENGVISFDGTWKYSFPENFPTSYLPTRNGYAVAPFWADNDIREGGAVRYITYSVDDTDDKLGAELMSFLNQYIQSNQQLGSDNDATFEGLWLLAAHWDHVHPSPHGDVDRRGIPESILNQTNNYQAIIVSDLVDTYVFNSYDMQWSAVGNGQPAVVGLNAGGNYFDNHPLSGTHAVGCAVNGQHCFAEDDGSTQSTLLSLPTDPSLRAALRPCTLRYQIDKRFVNLSSLTPLLEPCPCTLKQAESDCGRFKPQLIGDSQCFVSIREIYANGVSASQQCCYSSSGSLITSPLSDFAGTLLINNQPFVSDFRDQCCNVSSSLCQLYFERRPIDTCIGYQPLVDGLGYGDPHYRTFDGRQYDFQGIGEFTLLELYESGAGDPIFSIHGRLGQPSGWRPGVSGHIGLAFGDPSLAYHVGDDDGFRVYQTEPSTEEITDVLSNVPMEFHDRVSLTRLSPSSLRLCHYDSGASVDAQVHPTGSDYYINFMVRVPQSYMGQTKGLLGNFDGNPNIEFFRRNGSRIIDTTHRNLHSSLLSWNVSGDNLLLPPDLVILDDHVPMSIDDLTITDDHREICGDNMQCLLDLIATEEEAIAESTVDFEDQAMSQQQERENFPPVITTDAIYSVDAGNGSNAINFAILVTDANSDEVTLMAEGGIASAAPSLMETSPGQFEYQIPAMSDSSAIGALEPLVFTATDSNGATTVKVVRVEICACTNGGSCTSEGLSGLDSTMVLNCLCPEAYDGPLCENDRDGCLDIQCFEGTLCTDVAAPGSGALCSACPPGYEGDSPKCYDIDECALNSSLCEQVCINTDGGFTCGCNEGFEMVLGVCQDIDECASGMDDCHQRCVNDEGSYTCDCEPQFSLDSDGKTCLVNPDADCTRACGNGQCALVSGVELCFCDIGYRNDSGICSDDENECDQGACSQNCTNLLGSFECSCYSGYELQADGRSCLDIDECLQASLSGQDACADTPNSLCVNSDGSFSCDCVSGFSLVDGACQRNVCPGLNKPEGVLISYSTSAMSNGAYVSGSSATYSCEPHFVLSGDKLPRQCGEDGTWSGVAPVCTLVTCSMLDTIMNGAVTYHEDITAPFDALTVATYSCTTPGYRLAGGDSERECMAIPSSDGLVGEWAGTAPHCELITCGPLLVNSFASVIYIPGTAPSYPIEAYAISTCQGGYSMVRGDIIRRCMSDGTWNGEDVVCQLIEHGCEDIPDPKNGNIRFIGDDRARFTVGTLALYECDSGYELKDGDILRTCVDMPVTDIWTGAAPICAPITCPAIDAPAHGSVSYSTAPDADGRYNYTTVASFTCETGRGIVGEPDVMCEENGNSMDGMGVFKPQPPSCEPIFCEPLREISNSHPITYDSVGDTILYGAMANYSCLPGYVLMPAGTTKICTGDGKSIVGFFDGEDPVCEEIRCPSPPVLENGFISFSSSFGPPYDIGVSASYSCGDGFSLENGDMVRTCIHDGVSDQGYWTGVQPVCVGTCSPLNLIQYGTIEYSAEPDEENEYLAGTTVQFLCDEDFELFGYLNRTCQNNMTWTGSSPSCLRACPGISDALEFGSVEFTTQPNHDGYYRFGTSAQYTCEDTYKIVGLDLRVCGSAKEWTGEAPTCEPIKCDDLPDPKNGDILFSNDTAAPFDLGTVAEYKCYYGFVPVNGSSMRVCFNTPGTDFGQWDGEESYCGSVQCEALSAPANAQISYSNSPDPNYPYLTEVTYVCDPGYTADSGDTVRTCSMDGLSTIGAWSGQELVCIPIVPKCRDIDNPKNGRINFAEDSKAPFDIGTMATYHCDLGYEAEGGDVIRYCQEDGISEYGVWNGTAPQCLAAVICPELDVPDNASIHYSPEDVDTSRIGYGVTATYRCVIEGLGLYGGEKIRVCSSDGDYDDIGKWSERGPTCKPIMCEDIADPINGQILFSGDSDRRAPFEYGTKTVYECNDGYILNQAVNFERVCTGDGSTTHGQWTGEDPLCDEIGSGEDEL